MSGTSLDGLDVAYVEINGKETLSYRLIAAETMPYTDEWVARLSTLENSSAFDYALAHVQLSRKENHWLPFVYSPILRL